ncbi:ABC transporter ATP-binding protein [Endozoicomonas sp. SM1973]|uniref:ABC transporter ATP-binding protein n=1 Tax=Spartinivicinus marinus TaxID=2994442 RepID=A0A853I6R5_9GAMM|nr:ABC transporter ATP-binding protein [Spartinivicinus marinus]MCX4028286.1 ABC transporter ATP-binding protein [Spartinivicinus marinus]NYZ65621.1 ABC transporter ATP-binding protein [Spartinivicinus marinus]
MSTPVVISAVDLVKKVTTGNTQLTILKDLQLAIKAGESVAIVGASGAGKSTLLSILAGLDQPTSGEVILAGQPISHLNEDGRAAVRAQTVGFVFQSFQLLPGLTALENVMLPLELNGVKEAKASAIHWLTQVGLQARLDHYPKQLSGGEQQRVAIARAFVTEPKVLFADEPTGNLDQTTGATIIELLFELNQQHQTTLILVTHDIQLAERCQRQLHLDVGQLHEQTAGKQEEDFAHG